MKHPIVVISWWSNALGLTCLHLLRQYVSEARTVRLVQVGKPEAQKAIFRENMPAQIEEIPYSSAWHTEHFQVLEYLIRDVCDEAEGVWFVDHDFFPEADLEHFLCRNEELFVENGCVLAHLAGTQAITCPLFWVAPRHLPADAPSFAPVPPAATAAAKHFPTTAAKHLPTTACATPTLIQPRFDTLVNLSHFLARLNRVAELDINTLPAFRHLGGLHIFQTEPQEHLNDYCRCCLQDFATFFYHSQQRWLFTESAVLLARIQRFYELMQPGISRGDVMMDERKYTRRQFFPMLFQELIVQHGILKGGQGISMDALLALPQERLALLVPRMNPEWKFSLREGVVWATDGQTQQDECLFAAASPDAFIFNAINGRQTLATITVKTTEVHNCSEETAWNQVLALFARLFRLQICLPVNDPAELMGEGLC